MTWFNSGFGNVRLKVVLDDLRGLLNLNDSMIFCVCLFCSYLLKTEAARNPVQCLRGTGFKHSSEAACILKTRCLKLKPSALAICVYVL